MVTMKYTNTDQWFANDKILLVITRPLPNQIINIEKRILEMFLLLSLSLSHILVIVRRECDQCPGGIYIAINIVFSTSTIE